MYSHTPTYTYTVYSESLIQAEREREKGNESTRERH